MSHAKWGQARDTSYLLQIHDPILPLTFLRLKRETKLHLRDVKSTESIPSAEEEFRSQTLHLCFPSVSQRIQFRN